MSGHITLFGRNNLREIRTVEYDGAEIGKVIPAEGSLWVACDLQGRNHGDRWLSDWYAAQALVNGLGLGKISRVDWKEK
jgi:hypothetical protein